MIAAQHWSNQLVDADSAYKALITGCALAGPAGWDPVIRLQQIYLLVTFGAFVGIMAVESCRIQNRWRVLSL